MSIKTKLNLNFIEIESNPGKMVKKCIIWLHGLGADGNDFASIVPELNISKDSNIRFIFPHAPIMPVTINNGYEMRAWFDILGLTVDERLDHEGIAKSSEAITQLIEFEISKGLASTDIILAGFSQGGVMALTTGLQYPKALGGILALSCFLPQGKEVIDNTSEANCRIPVFMAHGTQDALVPYPLGEAACASLKAAGHPVSWHSYPAAHTVCAEEIKDISEWLNNLLLL